MVAKPSCGEHYESNVWKMSMLMIMTALLCSSASLGSAKPHYREIFHDKAAGPNSFGLLKAYAEEKHTHERLSSSTKQLSEQAKK